MTQDEAQAPYRRVRLVKVLVQPIFIIDDGENVEEAVGNQVEVVAKAWPTYSSVQFPHDVENFEALLNDPTTAEAPPEVRVAPLPEPGEGLDEQGT